MVLVYQSMEIKKSGMVKNNVGNFNSSLNLNFSSIISDLLEEKQRNSYNISTTPPERSAHLCLLTRHNLFVLRLAKTC